MEISETEKVDNVILSRISLREISVLSDGDDSEDIFKKSPLTNDERKWRLSYLRNQFESFELHNLFNTYTKKVNHGYFSLFLILQGLLTLSHFFFVILSNRETTQIVLPDLILYGFTIILSILGLYIVDKVAEKYKKFQYILTFGVIFFVNGFVPYYHKIVYGSSYRPAYSGHLIVACYLFIGINKVKIAALMGMMMSLFQLFTLHFISYSNDSMIWRKIASDAIFATFMNCLGIYYRYMNEIVIRRSFLDRRDCIMSTFQLRHEKKQVDQLMQSIIPDYVITKVKERYISTTKSYVAHGKYLKENPFENSLLDEHENVSILFADIVNYTEMTSKLKITDLLETLNDLFGLFDDASDKHKVTRIKFLGDCYYCVAGLPPETAQNPAEACVDLGLEMISIIAEVRMVHITNRTKSLLRKNYYIEPTNKGETCPQFKNYGIQTFLVKPIEINIVQSCPNSPTPRPSKFKKQKSFPNGSLLSQLQRVSSISEEETTDRKTLTFIEDANHFRPSDDRLYRKRTSGSINNNYSHRNSRKSNNASKRRTAFMNNNIKRYSERTDLVNKEMEKTIDLISFSKYQQYVKVKDINVLLLFNNWKAEVEYLKIPDALFKYYLLGAVCLIFSIYLIQNLTLKRWDWGTWPFIVTTIPILLIFIPISWAEYLYNKYVASYMNEVPRNYFLRILCKASSTMTTSFLVRLFTFLLIYLVLLVSVLNEMIECRTEFDGESQLSRNTTKTRLLFLLFSNTISSKEAGMINCVLPWHMTETCAMTVIMSFLFLRIFIWIKLVLGIATIGLYAFCVLSFSRGYYQDSETINNNLQPQIAHIMSTVFITVTLHLVDRQTDYMNRLDYLLNKRFRSEQEEANLLQKVNENLLVNILPKHVARLYLDVSREQKELYFEEHNNVAVMFASILTETELQDILDEQEYLRLMNTYITEFDTLTNREEFQSIEKIKIAKWTYMVACGLFPGGKAHEIERHQTSVSLETLLNFVSQMFKKLEYINRTHFQKTKLRIGISHGDIAAGVVGSKKPLYDIWGDPVNMASRMDSTGIPNHIQVMENTAEIIQNLGYSCMERGNIKVKGRQGLVTTYFVEIDNKFNLVRKKPDDF